MSYKNPLGKKNSGNNPRMITVKFLSKSFGESWFLTHQAAADRSARRRRGLRRSSVGGLGMSGCLGPVEQKTNQRGSTMFFRDVLRFMFNVF